MPQVQQPCSAGMPCRSRATRANPTCSCTRRSPSATRASSVAVTGSNCGRLVCFTRRRCSSLKSAASSAMLVPARGGRAARRGVRVCPGRSVCGHVPLPPAAECASPPRAARKSPAWAPAARCMQQSGAACSACTACACGCTCESQYPVADLSVVCAAAQVAEEVQTLFRCERVGALESVQGRWVF